jgi:hypothetical protein
VQVVYRLVAGRDIAEARRWYDAKRVGLGREFRQAVRVVESLIKSHPDAFPKVHGEIRRVPRDAFSVCGLLPAARLRHR